MEPDMVYVPSRYQSSKRLGLKSLQELAFPKNVKYVGRDKVDSRLYIYHILDPSQLSKVGLKKMDDGYLLHVYHSNRGRSSVAATYLVKWEYVLLGRGPKQVDDYTGSEFFNYYEVRLRYSRKSGNMARSYRFSYLTWSEGEPSRVGNQTLISIFLHLVIGVNVSYK